MKFLVVLYIALWTVPSATAFVPLAPSNHRRFRTSSIAISASKTKNDIAMVGSEVVDTVEKEISNRAGASSNKTSSSVDAISSTDVNTGASSNKASSSVDVISSTSTTSSSATSSSGPVMTDNKQLEEVDEELDAEQVLIDETNMRTAIQIAQSAYVFFWHLKFYVDFVIRISHNGFVFLYLFV
jgi:hypothetical protein